MGPLRPSKNPSLSPRAACHVRVSDLDSCVCCALYSWLCRAASQLGDNYSLIKGPGLAPGSTVSSYLEAVRCRCTGSVNPLFALIMMMGKLQA
jgi:hypothetical protein